MKRNLITVQEQEAIIAEYLLGETSYRKLAASHGVDHTTIRYWVLKLQGIEVKKAKSKAVKDQDIPQEELPTDVKQLQEELRKARLHNKLLNTMIDIAEEQLKIEIRKKSGTKQ